MLLNGVYKVKVYCTKLQCRTYTCKCDRYMLLNAQMYINTKLHMLMSVATVDSPTWPLPLSDSR